MVTTRLHAPNLESLLGEVWAERSNPRARSWLGEEANLERAVERTSFQALKRQRKSRLKSKSANDCAKFEVTIQNATVRSGLVDSVRNLMRSTGRLQATAALTCLGVEFHPAGGWTGWHRMRTPAKCIVQFVLAARDSASEFRLVDGNEVQRSREERRWLVRTLRIDNGKTDWHCVFTSVDRVSVNFAITEAAA